VHPTPLERSRERLLPLQARAAASEEGDLQILKGLIQQAMNDTDLRIQRASTFRAPAFPRLPDASMNDRDWPPAAPPGAKLKGVGRAILRHFWLIVFTLVCLNGVAIAIVMTLPPRYTAEAVVLIGPREAQVTDMKAVITGLSGESDMIESEMQVLHSRRLARRVVEDLRLDRNPEFNPSLAPPSVNQRVSSKLGGLLHKLLALVPPSLRPSRAPAEAPVRAEAPAPRDLLSHATDALLHHLSISAKGHSRVVGITVDAANPIVAADTANAVAETYIDQQLHAKTDATMHAHEWLEDRVAELHQQASDADKALEAYRQKSGVLRGSNATLVTEQITSIGQQIIQAQGEKASASARLQTLEAALASRSGLESLPEVQNSPLIRDLRQQETVLTQQAADLASFYGSNYSKLASVTAQLAAVRARVNAELGRTAEQLRNAVRSAEAQAILLQQALADLRLQNGVSKEREIELHSLQQEADADHALYERLLSRSKETQIEVGLEQPDGQIISVADPPDGPSFPNPLLMLPASFVASIMVATLLVVGLESLDLGLSSMEQVEALLGVTALGVVPRIARGMRLGPEMGALAHAGAVYNEAIRSFFTSLLLSGSPKTLKTVLIASANPGEGKTTLVLSFARLMADCGKRVAIVDCDVRRPSLHKAAGTARAPGLTDCLMGRVELTTALKRDPASGIWLLPAGEQRSNAPDLLASDRMNMLVRALGEQFDLVLLDSAPVLVISDTRALARFVDATVVVARWNSTTRLQVGTALRQIADAGGNIAGVVLSMVDLRRYARHGESGLSLRNLRLYLAK
jgi:polysaccharide biosynthesis transport protein